LKIYTRTGDSGETGLYGGSRIRKDALRVEAYGTLDELNASLGVVLAALDPKTSELRQLLTTIQSELFDMGAELATPQARAGSKLAQRLHDMEASQVEVLERAIDRYETQLEPLKTFILPGGSAVAATLHLARAVARRAERRVVSLSSAEPINPEIIRYLNRVSDLLFVLARTANRLAGIQETPWTSRTS
jgi:cob(I)alamin adenosyltransferase